MSASVSCHYVSSLTALQQLIIPCCLSLATDWQFAFTREGKRIPFATAGDCYSATRCPQVRTTPSIPQCFHLFKIY